MWPLTLKSLVPLLFSVPMAIRCGAVFDDPGKRRQSFNIVNHRRATEKTMGCRKGRLAGHPLPPSNDDSSAVFAANKRRPSVNDQVYVIP